MDSLKGILEALHRLQASRDPPQVTKGITTANTSRRKSLEEPRSGAKICKASNFSTMERVVHKTLRLKQTQNLQKIRALPLLGLSKPNLHLLKKGLPQEPHPLIETNYQSRKKASE